MDSERAWEIGRYGDVESRLGEIVARARRQWRTKLAQQNIATATNLAVQSIALLENDTAQSYSFKTIAALCWYFDCQPADLLEYRPPAGKDTPHLAVAHIGRTASPAGHPSAADLQMINHIPARLAPYPPEQIAAATNLHRDGVILLQQAGQQRIYRRTLAAICWFLDCGIGDLLVYQYLSDYV